MVNRKDFRPNDNSSSSISDKDRAVIQKENKRQNKANNFENISKEDIKELKKNPNYIKDNKPHYEEYSGEDLPVYKIDGKLYYRDLRLGEYRNIENPNDKHNINIDNSNLQIPNKKDKEKLMQHDIKLGKNFPDNHEIYYISPLKKKIDFETQSRRSIKAYPNGEQYLMRSDVELSEKQQQRFYKEFNKKGVTPQIAFDRAQHSRKQ